MKFLAELNYALSVQVECEVIHVILKKFWKSWKQL